jgi:hypothetical protein
MDKKTQFIRSTHVIYWINIADELHHSSKVLETDINEHKVHYQDKGIDVKYPVISGSYILLSAYSMENLFKALLLVERPEFQNEEKIDKKLFTHNLVTLAQELSNIELEIEEIGILKTMSKSSVYWSRYPIPRHFSDTEKRVYIDKEFINIYKVLYKRVRDKIFNITEFGYSSTKGRRRLPMRIEEDESYFEKGVNEDLKK